MKVLLASFTPRGLQLLLQLRKRLLRLAQIARLQRVTDLL
jgi:hypothetical protein